MVQPYPLTNRGRMPSIPALAQWINTILLTAVPTLSPWTARRLTDWLLSILLMPSITTRVVAWGCALGLSTAARAASHERRLRRTYRDSQLSWSLHRAILTTTLRFAPAEAVTVIIDETTHTDHWTLLTAALWYHGRAIPLAWVLHPGNTRRTTAFWMDTATLLDRVQQVLPATTDVVVVADRAFGCPAFTDQVAAHGWGWVVRVQGHTRMLLRGHTEVPIRTLVGRGQRVVRRGQAFKKAGWRTVTVVAEWTAVAQEPLLLVSTLAGIGAIRHAYGRRSAIEALFRDWKTGGWQWEASQSRSQTTQEALVLGMAIATVLVLLVGTAEAQAVLAERGDRPSPRRPWAARESLFRLGRYGVLRWLWTGTQPALGARLSLAETALHERWATTVTRGGRLGTAIP
ncbi:transposase IS4 family protein [Herpetosiphon aurantiacus DSM 785]|uniref:Transposase IS4 family protein n=1 Tax=Herpetosiphon aurantiacus (strain ATCC 23779 / DSM 785 / 114-95) TaxID=316274 RepID=A9AUY5_HERA2|nr:transposase IS4 family protein [Herpetosiphon aurantiacus DSM 785]ABX06573.1 transposase IS4 family protein [Herpetosiphon aurantiacus DSM 785]